MFKFLRNKKVKINSHGGFTLIELLVTLSIFVIVTTVILFSQNQFNGSILLSNLSYDLALSIRQAQTFGVGGKSLGFVETQPIYGVYLDTSSSNNKSIVFFADTSDGNKKYTPPVGPACTGECVEKYNIKKGNIIHRICDYNINDKNCENQTNYSSADITFKRPDPDATIVVKNSGGDIEASDIRIVVGNGNSQYRSVVVTTVGQIFIQR